MLQVPYLSEVAVSHSILSLQEREDLGTFGQRVFPDGHFVLTCFRIFGVPLADVYFWDVFVIAGGHVAMRN